MTSTASRLTTHTAELRTATVEIKTLSVSGRQVTLAVFRQLEKDTLFEPKTWECRGTPWGRVNYHPGDGCTGQFPRLHHHVVWQLGDALRRTVVVEPRDADAPVPIGHGSIYLDVALAVSDWRPPWDRHSGCREVHLNFDIPGVPPALLYASYHAREFLDAGDDWERPYHLQRRAQEYLGHSPTTTDLDELRAKVVDELRAVAVDDARHAEAWRTICDLPQLFIAV